MRLPDEMHSHYAEGHEHARLTSATGQLEFRRTCDLIRRFAPKSPARVLDIGGGAGVYTFVLARMGYEVELIDAVPLHIQQAHEHPDSHLLKGIRVGDARHLDCPDNSYDLALFMGPLYHLTDRTDRILALREAHRVLRSGGILLVAAISRFASLFDGFLRGYISDPIFEAIVAQDLVDGQHRNPTNNPSYFTTTKFHSAAELEEEMGEAGLKGTQIIAVEGLGGLIPNLASMDEIAFEQLIQHLERVESEREIIGISAHMIGVVQKKSPTNPN